ncbi:hypothetical protein QBC40DRAFT_312589 [Triangularia verruculosa]|uniref:Aminoglycoside phosphotransferase domain-containing protein n=1 Tax=Triangularia verruculosa TaxID=2587418 RepID=A0AAN6XAU1_9PEZI|nr:hypothetical protein QBC40DRAFT_312589 [Triangularia verruculosa]
MIAQSHINSSIKRISATSWLIGQKLLLSRSTSRPQTQPSWSDGEEGFFVLSDAPQPLPQTEVHPEDSPELPQVYAAGDQAAVWRAGDAYIKVHDIKTPNATREHTTLRFLYAKAKDHPLGFEIPDILYYGGWDNREYHVLTRVSGQTLATAWPSMDDTLREFYVTRVAEICKQLSAWTRDSSEGVGGVDGGIIQEMYLTTKQNPLLDPQHLAKSCGAMGMDISSPFSFYHTDLGPTNILVDPKTRSIGIIDWETAGYVPVEWVRTKFRLSSGMNFPQGDGDNYNSTDWRRLVAVKLGEMGFKDAVEGWLAYRASKS